MRIYPRTIALVAAVLILAAVDRRIAAVALLVTLLLETGYVLGLVGPGRVPWRRRRD
jgi:hypothetical protein